MKVITMTSKEYKKIEAKRKEDATCPECGEIALFNSCGEECVKKLFKERIIKKVYYSCFHCGCQWEIVQD